MQSFIDNNDIFDKHSKCINEDIRDEILILANTINYNDKYNINMHNMFYNNYWKINNNVDIKYIYGNDHKPEEKISLIEMNLNL